MHVICIVLVFVLQDVALTLNANPNNVVDVVGSSKCNTHVILQLPVLSAAIERKHAEYDAALSTVSFNIVADALQADPDADGTFDGTLPSSASRVCRAVVSLPKQHPKSLLQQLVRYLYGVCFSILLTSFD